MTSVAPNEARLLATARRLIQAESENPPGREAEAARRCREYLLPYTKAIQTIEGAPGRPSIVADWPASLSQGRPALLWLGHLDVVPAGDPDQWQHPPYDAQVAGGRLYGRGAADMKGAIASLFEALTLLSESGFEPRRSLRIALVADEETMGRAGAAVLADRGLFAADGAVVGEPSQLQVLVAERGASWLRLTTRGRAAHASVPEQGTNAILGMAPLLTALHQWQPDAAAHPLLGSATLSVGTIQGGTKINMVPDRCVVEIDRRLLPGETPAAAAGALRAYLEDASPGTPFTLESTGHAEPFETPLDAPLTRMAQAAVAAVLGSAPPPGGMPGVTDGRYVVHQAGVPTVILGPGRVAEAHTVDESVAVRSLVDAARVYAALLRRALG